MANRILAAGLMVAFAGFSRADAQINDERCLHGTSESGPNRVRREEAMDYARRIVDAQTTARGLNPRGRPYRSLNQLSGLALPPSDFSAQLNTDGETYAFVVRDTIDPCRFAIFADQSGDLYAGMPTAGWNNGIRLLHESR